MAGFLSPPEVPEAAAHQIEAGQTNDPDLLEREAKVVRFGSEPVILIKVSDDDDRAFTATCTHLGLRCRLWKRAQAHLVLGAEAFWLR